MKDDLNIKTVGGRNLPSYWERFDRLQRTARSLLPTPISPKGVFRFKSFEEFEQWKQDLRQEHPKKTTS
jgi:hypothetical protein